ncbi:UDP-N-acetylmuramoyl-L-alanine--D-glutamate ligase [Fodinisporobacter ferrooxydans]|uniref:UDP-N-acetylmuramoylalanine--D-glutamate ligase n=1 Tax=Fodinisporobacter ferrooxydans TaxID=2901836 RepID=A0ABY4CF48_9BACL|nr:UDP-N-acetylmuramoyl-L-alanine--D-glutamate ligase [Alicyclobacillaceae bacterium MYW30-H2]
MQVNGKEILVLGAAKSGVAAALLLHQHGAIVTVNDSKPRDAIAHDVECLEEKGIRVVTGSHPEGIVHKDLYCIVKNPGIPYSAAPIAAAQKLSIPVYTEVEIAYQYAQSPFIGITGSNGKTTTTTLVGEMLASAHVPNVVAGNIGTALSTIVGETKPKEWIVAELSSFQLLGIETFRPKIAAILNIYQAHLDYHGDLASYRAAKSRLLMNQTDDDFAVLNYDNAAAWELNSATKARVIPFSRTQRLAQGVFVQEGSIHIRIGDKDADVCNVSELALPGEHNLENILAATAIAFLAGAGIEAIRAVLLTFRGVEHRLEYVKTVNQVQYFNDSKATNSDAAMRAIGSFAQPVVLIAGGLDRGDDFRKLEEVLARHVKAVVLLGQSRFAFAEAAKRAHVKEIELVDGLAEAVEKAAQMAAPGDVVLLSPACASWDMFQSFEERGSMFKHFVHTL